MKAQKSRNLLLSLTLSLLIVLGTAAAAPSGTALAKEAAGIPEYTVLKAPEGASASSGITQTPYWRSYTAQLPPRNTLSEEELPASYDLRDLGRSTTVKNQAPWGACWAFGALSSLESNILPAQQTAGTQAQKSPDYSERQLAWFAYEKQSAESLSGSETGTSQMGEGAATSVSNRLDTGGNLPQAAALLSTWQGAAAEAEIPYQNQEGNADGAGDWSVTAEKRSSSAVHLTDADFLPSTAAFSEYNEEDGTPTADAVYRFDETAAKAIKRAIMEHGTVAIAYYADQSLPGQSGDATYFNYTNYCQYVDVLNGSTLPNHSVSIVGWDDAYSRTNFNAGKQPEGDGAWIVKNSWGTDWGTGAAGPGYFYLSYYDRTVQQVTSFQGETDFSYEHNYQYDYLGPASNANLYPQEQQSGSANIFRANGNEELRAVSAVTASPGATVSVEVYRLKARPEGPYDGTLVFETVETLPYAGYHTIELDAPVPLAEGEQFSVVEVIQQTNGLYELPLEVSLNSAGSGNKQTAICNAGESYLVDPKNKASVDFTSPESGLPQGAGLTIGNAMIKAFTVDAAPEEAPELLSLTCEAYDRTGVLLGTQTLTDPARDVLTLSGPASCVKVTGATLSGGADPGRISCSVNGTSYNLYDSIPRSAFSEGESAFTAVTHSAPLGTDTQSYTFRIELRPTWLSGSPEGAGTVMVTDTNAYLPGCAVLGITELSSGTDYNNIKSALTPLGGEEKFYVLDLSLGNRNPGESDQSIPWEPGEFVQLEVVPKSEYLDHESTVLFAVDASNGNVTLRQIAGGSKSGVLRAEVDHLGRYVVAVVKKAPPPPPQFNPVTYSADQTLYDVGFPALEEGTWSWCDPSIIPTVGVKTYPAQFTPSKNEQYCSYEAEIPLTVNKSEPVLDRFVQTNDSFSYGQALSECTFTATAKEASGTAVSGSAAWKDGTAAPAASDGASCELVFIPDDSENYSAAVFQASIKVNKAPVTVTPVDTDRAYGDPNPEFAYTITSGPLFYGDTKADLAVTLTSDATETTAAGTEAAITGASSSQNYLVTVASGKTLAITQRPLHVKVKNIDIQYGEQIPEIETEVTNLANGDTAESVFSQLAYEGLPSQPLVGQYSIYLALNGGTSLKNPNYQLLESELEPGTLSILPVAAGGVENRSTTISDETAAQFKASGNLLGTETLVIADQKNGQAAAGFQRKVSEDQTVGLTFDASLTGLEDDTLKGWLNLEIPVGTAYNGKKVTVLHYVKQGELTSQEEAALSDTVDSYEDLIVEDGKVTVWVYSLSPFAVLLPKEPSGPAEPAWNNPFTDVAEDSWYYQSVCYAYEHGLFLGVTDTAFAPKGVMTREMLAVVLWRAAGKPESSLSSGFSDVAKGRYYEEAVNWAKEQELVYGLSETKFGVGTPVSRQDIAAMLWRWGGKPISRQSLSGFADSQTISGYAMPAVRWAVEENILAGKGGGVLDPRGSATRAEVAVLLNRYLER